VVHYVTTMQKDAINRRKRFAGRQPLNTVVIPNERDVRIMEVLQRHGPLPSTYLHAFVGGYENTFKDRLTKLYNEPNTPHGGSYLDRPWQQSQSFNARYQPLMYEITTHGRMLLETHGKRDQYAPPPSGQYVHRFMTSTLTASIELACQKHGLRYISPEEILSHPKCVNRTLQLPVPLLGMTLIPDQLFGIEYNGKFRFFALEADRNHETINSERLAKNSYGRKIHAYREVFATSLYRSHWGLPNLMMLTVTTNNHHMRSMMEYVKTHAGDTSPFLFKVKEEFGRHWKVPPLMFDLLETPWLRTDGTFDIAHA